MFGNKLPWYKWPYRGSPMWRWVTTLPPIAETEFASNLTSESLIVWVTYHHVSSLGVAKNFPWSYVPLPDSESYYNGFKEGRLRSVPALERAQSDYDGTLETSRLTMSIIDTDRLISSFYGNNFQQYIHNRYLTVYGITDQGRRNGDTPRILFRGVVRNIKFGPNFLVDLDVEDASTYYLDQPTPQRIISKQMLPLGPAWAWDSPVPIIYGELNGASGVHSTIPGARGVAPTIYTGVENIGGTDWRRFLVSGHACRALLSVYQHDGDTYTDVSSSADVLHPDKVGWPFSTRYRDFSFDGINNRFTVIYAKGTIGDEASKEENPLPLYVNVQGVENTGDGTGSLITDIALQYKHFVVNWAFSTYYSGVYANTVDVIDGVPIVDTGSFDEVNGVVYARYGGGGPGAIWIGDKNQRLSDIFAHFNRSLNGECFFTRDGQFRVTIENPDGDAVASVDHIRDIIAGSFSVETEYNELYNEIVYSHTPEYPGTNFLVTERVKADPSIAGYRIKKSSPDTRFGAIRNSAIAEISANWRLSRFDAPPLRVQLDLGLVGLNYEIGMILAVTHPEGPGGGWTNQKLRITQHAIHADTQRVTLVLRSLGQNLVVPPDEEENEEVMAERALGGSRNQGLIGSGIKDAIDWWDVRIDWSLVPVGYSVKVRAQCRVENAATTITPQIYEVTTTSIVQTGSGVVSTTWTEQTLTIPASSGIKQYRLRGEITGNTSYETYFIGALDVIP